MISQDNFSYDTANTMSDDEADPELLELLRKSLGWSSAATDDLSSDTGEYMYLLCFKDCGTVAIGRFHSEHYFPIHLVAFLALS